jgi:hypothetical protein
MFALQSISFQQLKPLRRAYLKTITAPLDGMWEDAFFPSRRMTLFCRMDEQLDIAA